MNKYQQRNDEMARLHVHEGWTYEAIGKRFGISRERVRQILQRADAVDQKRTRALRLEKRTLAIHASQAEFDERAGTGIRALLIEGAAPGEIARRLSILGPTVSEEQVRSFADRHHVPMPKAQAAHFADPVLRIAVLAAVAATAGLRPDPIDALRMGSVELALLVEACASVTEMEEAAALACRARRNRDALTISQTGYSRWRDAWLDRFPKSGLYPWPVTSQTIMKRLGGGFWNDALRDVGLGLSARGRSRGRVIYTGDDDYEDTMAAFVADAVDAGMRPVA